MALSIRQPTLTAPRLSETEQARVRAELAGNPRFQAWQRRFANNPTATVTPRNFGINLPGDVWVNPRGELVSPDNSFAWGPFLATVGAGAGAGFGGAALAGGAGASSAAPSAVNFAGAPSTSGLFAPTGLVGTTAATAAPAVSTGGIVGNSAAGTILGLTRPELWRIGGGAADTILGLIGNRSQSRAAQRVADLQAQGIREQLAFERENEARRRLEYDRAEAQAKAQWDAEQARRAPYRAAAAAILARYTGQPASAYTAPRPMPPTLGPRTIGDLIAPRY